MDLDWIRRGLEKPGKTRMGLAAALGRNPSAITALLSGKRQLRAAEIAVVARYLGVSPTVDTALAEQIGTTLNLSISGEVAAGVWRESGLSYDLEKSDVALTTKWPADQVLLLRVRGSHINQKARDGDLVLCLRVSAAPRAPIPGDYVLVERRQGNLIETSVRRVVTDSVGHLALEADTDDQALQGLFPIGDGQDGSFSVIGFVLQFIRPATVF